MQGKNVAKPRVGLFTAVTVFKTTLEKGRFQAGAYAAALRQVFSARAL